MSKKYSLLIFDWDGTLMDSRGRFIECFCMTAQAFDLPQPDKDQLRSTLISLGVAEQCKRLFPSVDVIKFSKFYENSCRDPHKIPPLFYEVKPLLQELKKKNYLLAIATGMASSTLNYLMETYAIKDYFDCIRCADQTKLKPHPQMLLEILKETGCCAKESLMIGDSVYDIAMARQADMDALGIIYGQLDEPTTFALAKYKPLACIDKLSLIWNYI